MDGSGVGYTKLVSLLRRKRRRATRGWLRDSTYGDGPPAQAAAVAPLPVPALTICGAKEEEKNKKKLKSASKQTEERLDLRGATVSAFAADALHSSEILGKEGREEGGEEDTDEAEEQRWRSAAYDAHFGVEWSPAELRARHAALRPRRWELPGLGNARAQSSDPELPPAPVEAEACLSACGVLPTLRDAWLRAHGDAPLDEAQASLLRVLSGYRDLLHTDAAYEAHGALLRILALHTLQHALVTQRLVLRHQKKGLAARDQGFTRPKVLVVLPFRSHALAFVRELLALMADGTLVENKSRFVAEFDDTDGEPMPASKPADYRSLFSGNHDDCFRVGLRLQRKVAKLYAPFSKADVVVASPLGLRLGLGDEADEKHDADWLSSIEVLIAPYADVFTMQNWSHVRALFTVLNQLPRQQRGTDFSRVRAWYLDGHAARLRQTCLLAAHPCAELAALLRACANTAGAVTVGRTRYAGTLAASPPGLRQLFVRFDTDDPATADDARLDAFRAQLLPSICRGLSAGADGQTLLFVPSYFDFVRVKAVLEQEDLLFAAVSEYSTPKDVSRARTSFVQNKLPLLLYTERAHFFRRHQLRGARNLAVYAPPSNAHFYVELAQMLEGGGGSTSVVLYCRLDLMPLQRLVGSERAARMLKDEKASFLFC